MATAVQNLREPDPELQVLGAAYIQHECYNDSDAKVEVQIKQTCRKNSSQYFCSERLPLFILDFSMYVSRPLVDVSLALMMQPFVVHQRQISLLKIDPNDIVLKGIVIVY